MRASSAPQQRHTSGPGEAIGSRNGGAERLTPGQSPAARPLDGPLLRPEQVAALLSVKTSWVYDAVRTGKLPCLRVGRHIRFTRGMLEEWLGGR
jgi:excisionase family DNA binding protein